MTLDERFELVVKFIEGTIDQADVDVSEGQKGVIRSRAAELQAEPTIGLTWD